MDIETSITALQLQGLDQRQIAKKLGKSQSTISRRLNSESIKRYQDVALWIQFSHIKQAVKTVLKLMYTGKTESIRLKAAQIIMEGTGITATRTPPLTIQHMSNQVAIISPGVLELLGLVEADQDVQDVPEVIDIESE